MESKIVRARVWKFPENVNTDQIIPNRAYYFTPEEQLAYIFDAMRPGWIDEMERGDVIVSEPNFGMGSSRPAARNLALLGIGCLVSESINGLFDQVTDRKKQEKRSSQHSQHNAHYKAKKG